MKLVDVFHQAGARPFHQVVLTVSDRREKKSFPIFPPKESQTFKSLKLFLTSKVFCKSVHDWVSMDFTVVLFKKTSQSSG